MEENTVPTMPGSLIFSTDPPSHATPLPAGSPSPSPRKSPRQVTEPLPHGAGGFRIPVKKRIIVCCDGTWQDGVSVDKRSKYTNILRLARTINYEDERFNPPIPQIVFYQSGIGSEDNVYSQLVDGTTGDSCGAKVEEAYAFIAHNYHPGDEIFLFGFSRGAYTARMVAMFIGEVGVLDRQDMDNFASIFIDYQKRGKTEDPAEKAALDKKLSPWIQHDSPGKKRADSDQDSFSIKCVGVFDTVGSLGLPEELTRRKSVRTLFGFPDKILGEHIERAYQALALNETRGDFNCAKFEQAEGGRRKKQVLKQCWFTGCHSDIGGGYPDHDLSDLTLTWMAAHVGDMLALDLKYLSSLPDPVAPWGEHAPHDPTTGIFSLASTIQRQLPTSTNDVTNETIHPSVLRQAKLFPSVQEDLDKHPELVCELTLLEEEMRINWPFKPGQKSAPVGREESKSPADKFVADVTRNIVDVGKNLSQTAFQKVARRGTGIATEGGEPVYEKNWLGELADKAAAGFEHLTHEGHV